MKIFIIICAVILFLIIILYNIIVSNNNRCKNAWHSIDNQLKRRKDLIPNLIEITKGYAKYESETLEQIINARNNNVKDIANNSAKISNSINKLLAISESYPDLKANKSFENLQIELVGTEDKIAFARQFYNDCVYRYNNIIMSFPNNILANIFGFTEKDFFEVTNEEKENVEVKF